jgi:hypothetical protein
MCPSCSSYTTDDACTASGHCHSVFESMPPNLCTTIVCTVFLACHDGAKAACSGMPTCGRATPYCETGYVISYTSSCYEGCVRPAECGM